MKYLQDEVVLVDVLKNVPVGTKGQTKQVRERVAVRLSECDACWKEDGVLYLRGAQWHPDTTARGVVTGYTGRDAAAIEAA